MLTTCLGYADMSVIDKKKKNLLNSKLTLNNQEKCLGVLPHNSASLGLVSDFHTYFHLNTKVCVVGDRPNNTKKYKELYENFKSRIRRS